MHLLKISCVFEVCLLELRTGCLKAGDIIRYMDISRRLVQCAPESFYDSYTPVTSKEWQNKIPLKKCTLDTPLLRPLFGTLNQTMCMRTFLLIEMVIHFEVRVDKRLQSETILDRNEWSY